MKFFISFLRNLGILLLLGLVISLIAPQMMRQVFELYGALFVLLVIVMLIVAALPSPSRR